MLPEISQSVKVAEASVFTLTPPPLPVVAVLEMIVQLSNVASESLKTTTPPPCCRRGVDHVARRGMVEEEEAGR